EGDFPPPVDHDVGLPSLADFSDPVSLDVDLCNFPLHLDVPDQDAHRRRPSAFATIVRVRAAFARCVSRICSKERASSTRPWAKSVGMVQNARKSSGTTNVPGRIVFLSDPVDDVPRMCVTPTSFRAHTFAR